MIKSFGDKTTATIFVGKYVKGLPTEIQIKAFRKLRLLSNATELRDLQASPGNRLKKMKGRWKDWYRVNVSDKYRIKFRWNDGDAYDVEFGDDHDEI